jgi:tRNA threonylcarbamoyladenosine biosynthesis protein TsaB
VRVLALDTCLAACSVAVIDGERLLASASEPMMRGHQERLALMAQEVMREAGLAFAALDRIGVTVGPGSFTGLRVGVAFAKGLSVALGKPCVGIGALEALAAERSGLVVAAVDARRDQVYVQAFRDGAALMAPSALHADDAMAQIARFGTPDILLGTGAALLASAFPGAQRDDAAVPDPAAIARLSARTEAPVKPLYLRAPDAKLPAA